MVIYFWFNENALYQKQQNLFHFEKRDSILKSYIDSKSKRMVNRSVLSSGFLMLLVGTR